MSMDTTTQNLLNETNPLVPGVGINTEQLQEQARLRTIEELQKLDAALQQNLPEYKECLREINKLLRSFPGICHVLRDEDIGVVVRGLVKESDSDFFNIGKTGKDGSGNAKSEKGKLKELLSLDTSQLGEL